jgi:nitrogen regulatory protein PII
MQLFVLILNKTECLPKFLGEFLSAGIKGATIYDSMGEVQYIGHETVEPPPIFGSLRKFINPDHEQNKTVLVILRDEQVEAARAIVNKVTGGLDKPGTGIIFTVPVSFVEGI